MLSSSEMYCIDLSEIKQCALEAKEGLWQKAQEYGRDVKIYLHWSAGRYEQFWEDYHLQIDQDGICYIQNGITLASVLAATYKRNSGSVAIALLGCFDATTNQGLGSAPPTLSQIETMSRIIAVLASALSVSVDLQHVMTHGEAADNEDGCNPGYEQNGYPDGMYGPKHSVERWDLEYLGTKESPAYRPYATDGSRGGDVLRGKANWYLQEYEGKMERYF